MVRLVAHSAIDHAPEELRSCIKHVRVLGTDRACADRGLDANRANAAAGTTGRHVLAGRRPNTRDGAPARRRQAAIIFDDGLRSNVRLAYPMLRALGIPATFFVCPGLIEERRWLWTHEARRRLQFARPQLRHELARERGAPAEVEKFVQWMKQLDFPRRTRVEGGTSCACSIHRSSPSARNL
jgi:hypothetical protein